MQTPWSRCILGRIIAVGPRITTELLTCYYYLSSSTNFCLGMLVGINNMQEFDPQFIQNVHPIKEILDLGTELILCILVYG